MYIYTHKYVYKCCFRTFSSPLLNYEIFIQNNICNIYSMLLSVIINKQSLTWINLRKFFFKK